MVLPFDAVIMTKCDVINKLNKRSAEGLLTRQQRCDAALHANADPTVGTADEQPSPRAERSTSARRPGSVSCHRAPLTSTPPRLGRCLVRRLLCESGSQSKLA